MSSTSNISAFLQGDEPQLKHWRLKEKVTLRRIYHIFLLSISVGDDSGGGKRSLENVALLSIHGSFFVTCTFSYVKFACSYFEGYEGVEFPFATSVHVWSFRFFTCTDPNSIKQGLPVPSRNRESAFIHYIRYFVAFEFAMQALDCTVQPSSYFADSHQNKKKHNMEGLKKSLDGTVKEVALVCKADAI